MTARSSSLRLLYLCAAAAALSACSHAETALSQQPSAAAAPVSAEAPPPMTREQASTDCWMKYDKEARHLGLDQKLPLVEKCVAEKLKTKGAAR